MSRILLDTNILILREDISKVPSEVQRLLRILGETRHRIVIHPLSLEEIKNDRDPERREIVLSKIDSYPQLESPPSPEDDDQFLSLVGHPRNPRDFVDNSLLYCVYRDAVSFLITEDVEIHKKARRLRISDRVFTIAEALDYFAKEIVEEIPHPTPLRSVPVYMLDVNDPIFESLKEEYKPHTYSTGFYDWWSKICREGRKAWVHYLGDRLGAVLILKDENEPIASNPPLPAKRRLKICTLIVTPEDRGKKIGELFIKISVQTAIQKGLEEIYLTHFTKDNDFLVNLIEEFGFEKVAVKGNGEDVFLKRLIPDRQAIDRSSQIYRRQIYRRFYPSFYDGPQVNKFIVPIRPEWHNRLFTDYSERRQLTLWEAAGDFIVEGNTIKKAYLCHSRIRGMQEGDILLFYRSHDVKGLTALGVIEKAERCTDADAIISHVGKRSVYSVSEIRDIAQKPTQVILFWWITYFTNPIEFDWLRNNRIIRYPPRTINKIPHDKYILIKEVSGIDARYIVS